MFENIESEKKNIKVNAPKDWSIHANGLGNNIFLVDPEGHNILFRIDNVPYFCTTTALIYLTYQFSSFIPVNDLEIKEINVDTHSNVDLKFEIKSGRRKYRGEIRVFESKDDIKMVGYASSDEKMSFEQVRGILGI
ncbi:MAG: hypothetical protein ACP6IP_02920 [Candidatus Njordarchaeia archaeon]